MRAIHRFAWTSLLAFCLASTSTAWGQIQPQVQQPQVPPRIQPGATFQGGINQTPWFTDPTLRQQLKFNDDQFNRLNKAYNEAWTRYQKGINQQLNNTLTDAQRQQRMRDFTQNFYRDLATTSESILTDPQQRQRFNQLNWQYRGFDAFTDPTIQQKLNLTAEQTQKLNQFRNDWSTQMNTLGSTFQTNREAATKQFNQLRTTTNERINSVLTPEQQKTWRELMGDPYNFQPNLFFPGGISTPNTNP
jgi:hypothetical protein